MWFLALGVLGGLLKYFEMPYFVDLSWWYLLIPLGLAATWWAIADASGFTARKAMEREAKRREERVGRKKSQLGMLGPRGSGRRGRR